jgi:hypothetical protein
MEQIQHLTLLVAIQSVDAEIGRMAEELESQPDLDDGGELETRLLKYTNAAANLRAYYEQAQRSTPTLPPYDSLAKHS